MPDVALENLERLVREVLAGMRLGLEEAREARKAAEEDRSRAEEDRRRAEEDRKDARERFEEVVREARRSREEIKRLILTVGKVGLGIHRTLNTHTALLRRILARLGARSNGRMNGRGRMR